MVYNREVAAKRAEASTTNIPDTCQLWTHDIFGVGGVGDFDGDGSSDAEDGWKSEPVSGKHPGDRHPPRGVPVSYLGGSHDNGHRAVSLGNGMIRSTDAGGTGRVATVPLDWPERVWGLTYAGWSETIDGITIPRAQPKPPPPPPPPPPPSRGEYVDKALHDLNHAKGTGRRGDLIARAKKILKKLTPFQ